MNTFRKKLISFFLAFSVFIFCFAVIPAEKVSAITASKNTNDFIKKLGSMPSYAPSGENLYIVMGNETYAVDSTVLVAAMTQNEIIGSWNGPSTPNPAYYEAYKAQAVAAFSYVKYKNNTGEAVAVNPYNISVTVPHAQTVRLVEQVARQYVAYNGSVAFTPFTASAGLHTQSNQYAWGGSPIPYLQGKACKYDEEKSVKTYSREQMESILRNEGYNPTGDPANWLKIVRAYDDGYMYETSICGVRRDGDDIKNMLGLKSIKATISYNGTFTITTYGHGHGVGFSQIGALGYAKNDGWNYIQILGHYFSGTTVHGATVIPPDPPAQSGKGDTNHDGSIDVSDIILLQNHILGRQTLTGKDFTSADVNSDGSVDINDIIRIQNHILGRQLIP